MTWIDIVSRRNERLGRVALLTLPVTRKIDYYCFPRELLPFETVRSLGEQLHRDPAVRSGKAGIYTWRMAEQQPQLS